MTIQSELLTFRAYNLMAPRIVSFHYKNTLIPYATLWQFTGSYMDKKDWKSKQVALIKG